MNSAGSDSHNGVTAPDVSLPDNEVHIWMIELGVPDSVVPRLLQTLDADERAKALRYRFIGDQIRYIVSHAALREVLSRYLQVAAADVRFQVSAAGKPRVLQHVDSQTLYFNLSHSHQLAVVAISRTVELGVDIEYQRVLPDFAAVARRHYSATDLQVLAASDDAQQTFYRCWTAKEAIVKCCGSGLGMVLDGFTVLQGNQQLLSSLLVDAAGHGTSSRFLLHALQQLPAGYCGALACASRQQAASISVINEVWYSEFLE